MPSITTRQKRTTLKKIFRTLHRYFGICAALFVLVLSVTGILINHSGELGLNSQKVTSTWLLDQYNIPQPETISEYTQTHLRLISADEQLFLDKHLLLIADSPLIAATTHNDMVVAATDQKLYFLSFKGEVLEEQDRLAGLPTPIRSLGIAKNLWILAGDAHYKLDGTVFEWIASEPSTSISWINAKPVTEQPNPWQNLYRAEFLDAEQVLLDVHSGRLFGLSGVLFNDFIAIVLCFLAFSGLYLWIKTRHR